MSSKIDEPKVSTVGGFIAGGIAACGAVTFTNPIELIKTRMQLQGELSKDTKNVEKLYRNPIQAFGVIYRNEGIKGLQQGLMSGYYYQLGLNSCRFGFYEPSRYYLTKYLTPNNFNDTNIPQNLMINILAGFVSGSAGAVVSNPFFLIKTRMQSYNSASHMSSSSSSSTLSDTHSSKPATNVGQQTYYKNSFDGIQKIFKQEGFKGLFRGVDAAILRTGAGSSAQLSTYYYAKNAIINHNIVNSNSIALHFLSSSFAGVGVAIVMNPWDVILTRVYNQKGNLYSGPIDCFQKTLRTEGVAAFYKGFWAQLFRIAPHSILTLMFMEQCVSVISKVESSFK